MPRRSDLKRIMVIGSGPIVIGQGCEFDYSGTQAVKALKEEGCEVILVNSNPATIMTDPDLADRTYIEPIEPDTVAAIVRRERPDALLPTLGGQTGLNTALALAKSGVLEECGTELIGANAEVIEKAESRELFRATMESIGLSVPRSGIAHCLEDVRRIAAGLSFPLIVRPAFTLGGSGGGVAYNQEDLESIAADGLAASLCQEVLVEESVMGWKEIEMEVMRDRKDNCVIICSIENLDPMGVHTGDSVTVAPVQTLTDLEYQKIRDASIAVMRAIGVETGGSNVQFGLNPKNGDMVVIEMNPRVSRSSALASKATGFPIAKIAAKLALGYTLDELPNDITRETMASFEPALDYCVVKIPRFTFEKFPGVKDELTTSMKSVGETMAIGRTFKEALQKGLRSLEIGAPGLGSRFRDKLPGREALTAGLRTPNSRRLFTIRQALLAGMDVGEIHRLSSIDPWFIGQIADIVALEGQLRDFALANPMEADNQELRELFVRAREYGFSDRQLAEMWKRPEGDVAALAEAMGIRPVYSLVDTCAAEFEAWTPYFYSTYGTEDERDIHARKKVVILGGGPNRIGQGIEFDYCCCQASFALRDEGVEAIMVNSNPETVSTDYDTSDRLYFEPLTFEDVMHIVQTEKPDGLIVQFGGQTPLNLAVPLQRAGIPILGTSPDAIDRAEDRERFQALIRKLDLRQPRNGTCSSLEEAAQTAARIGWPVIVRPSYVLGGRAMQICYGPDDLDDYFRNVVGTEKPEHPILIDQFLENAIEVDVDALADGHDVYVAGVMEHIEAAGIHSGDSACSLPPYSLPESIVAEIERQSVALARELRVAGLMNVQYAVQDGRIYILEVNPRASRTVPFVSKATGVPLPRLATLVMLGKTLAELDPWSMRKEGHVCVKEAVFPFSRLPGADIQLGPEMHSTGEVMGIAPSFDEAFLKSQIGAGEKLPDSGRVFISVNDRDKSRLVPVARSYAELGFTLLATQGTAGLLERAGLAVRTVPRLDEGRPNIVDMMKNGEVAMIVNTTEGGRSTADSRIIRQTALRYGIPFTTTIAGARAMARAIRHQQGTHLRVACLQDYYEGKKA